MAKKIVLVCALGLFLPLFLIKISFAISGECSYHDGVNCSVGPNPQGYAVCNDGWASSVFYSQTDECQASCLTPAEVTDRINVAEQEKNQYIQLIQNEYAGILSSDSALSSQEQTDCQSSASRMGVYNTGCTSNGSSNQYALDQAKEQLAISQEQANASAQEQQIENEQCTASVAPLTCPAGETLSGTTCACEAGRVFYGNVCISQSLYNSITAPSVPVVPSSSVESVAQNTTAIATTTTYSAPLITITQNLSVGSSGNNVSILQGFLESEGYLTLPVGTTDGYFGNLTKQALIAYQKSANVPATGYCGPMTRSAINNSQ